MKIKITLTIILCLIIGIIVTCFSSTLTGGISFSSGWSGMWEYLPRLGIPFSWYTKCPPEPGPIPAPTGCRNGFNLIAFILDVIFYTLLARLTIFFLKKQY